MSVRQRRIQLLLPVSPPSIMGTSQKKAIPRDRREAVKQSKNASQTRQCSSLGDWNAGKEEDSLPGPNFDVPRDLFRGTRKMKTRQVVHSLCNIISRHGVNTRGRTDVPGNSTVGPWNNSILVLLPFRPATVIIPSCRLPAGASSTELKMLPWVHLATCSHPTP